MKYRPAGNSIFFCLSWFSREQEEILQLFRKRLHGEFALVTTLDTNQKFYVDTFRIEMSRGGFVSVNVTQHHTNIYCRLDLRVRSNTSVSVSVRGFKVVSFRQNRRLQDRYCSHANKVGLFSTTVCCNQNAARDNHAEKSAVESS